MRGVSVIVNQDDSVFTLHKHGTTVRRTPPRLSPQSSHSSSLLKNDIEEYSKARSPAEHSQDFYHRQRESSDRKGIGDA